MNKWKLYIIIAIITVALFGLIVVQSTFIKRGTFVQEQIFNNFVQEAMLRVAVNIEEQEAYNYINKTTDINPSYEANLSSNNLDESYSLIYDNNTFTAEILKDGTSYIITAETLLELDEKVKDLELNISFSNGGEGLSNDFLNYNQNLFKTNFQVNYNNKNVELATDSSDLFNILSYELKRSGINTPFHFALLDGFSLTEFSSNCSDLICPNFFKQSYKTKVLINQFSGDEAYLLVDFPKKKTFLMKSNSSLLVSSFLFILLVVASFVASWFIIFRQKKLSELKTDFINNMTHELKTPVATISLASEMLGKEKVQKDQKKLNNYTGIIKEENKRLGDHIEKVLQIAQLDKEAIKLNKASISLHELLDELKKKFELRIIDAKAKVNWNYKAEDDLIYADKTHFLNVLSNLFDNALKYSKPEDIKIDITTHNNKEGIELSIKDNGIGMTKGDSKRIFEKFYRVPTGNIHNVKGFGLGLSYVKTMIEEHQGKININSELGKYTEFIIELQNK